MSTSKYKNTLNVSVLSSGHVHTSYLQSLIICAMKNVEKPMGMNLQFDILNGISNLSHGRSVALSQWEARSQPGDLFLFIDCDHTFEPTDIINIVARQKDLETDIVCGMYMSKTAICCLPDPEDANLLLYGGTGFMLITYDICKRIRPLIQQLDGVTEVSFSNGIDKIVPYFQNRIIADEGRWMGEDYSFCWLVRQVGGRIGRYASKTLGHEKMNILYVPEDLWNKTQ
jgi:hypothetical protein